MSPTSPTLPTLPTLLALAALLTSPTSTNLSLLPAPANLGPAVLLTSPAKVLSVSQHSSPLLHVKDKLSGDTFLVDTGSEVSIVMPRPGDIEAAVGPKLTAANGSGITTYGKRKRKIKLECGELSWRFIVAKAKNILGADMLRQFRLMPDLQGQRLVSFKSYSIVRGFLRHVPDGEKGISMVVTSVTGSFEEEIKQMVKQRPKLTEQTFLLAEAPHGIEHEIVTTGQPIRCRPRRQNPEKIAIAKTEFQFLEEMGIAVRSNSPWASPLHIVPKPDGRWRPCGDFRRLNAVTVPDSYSVPRIHDFANGLADRRWFSKVDLVKG